MEPTPEPTPIPPSVPTPAPREAKKEKPVMKQTVVKKVSQVKSTNDEEKNSNLQNIAKKNKSNRIDSDLNTFRLPEIKNNVKSDESIYNNKEFHVNKSIMYVLVDEPDDSKISNQKEQSNIVLPPLKNSKTYEIVKSESPNGKFRTPIEIPNDKTKIIQKVQPLLNSIKNKKHLNEANLKPVRIKVNFSDDVPKTIFRNDELNVTIFC